MDNGEILLYTANKWLAEYLTFYLTRDFDVTFATRRSEIKKSVEPKIIITDCEEKEFGHLMDAFPSAPVFLLSADEVEAGYANIAKHYQYPVDPDKVIGDIKEFAFKYKIIS